FDRELRDDVDLVRAWVACETDAGDSAAGFAAARSLAAAKNGMVEVDRGENAVVRSLRRFVRGDVTRAETGARHNRDLSDFVAHRKRDRELRHLSSANILADRSGSFLSAPRGPLVDLAGGSRGGTLARDHRGRIRFA